MVDVSDLCSLLNGGADTAKAVVVPELSISVSYQSLRDQTLQMAEQLNASGVRPGSRIATVFPNGLQAVVTFFAGAMTGTVLPLNPTFKYEEFCSYFREAAPEALLCAAESAEARCAAEAHGIRWFIVEVDPRGLVRLVGAPRGVSVSRRSPADVALVLFTSGSTARPKRVPLTHRQLTMSCANIVTSYRLSAEDISLCVMPLFHVHGLIASMLSTFMSGGSVILPSKITQSNFWEIARRQRVSWYSAVPAFHRFVSGALAGANQTAPAERLRFVRSCSASLSKGLTEKLENVLRVPVLEAYGMTEACHQICSNPLPPAARKPGTVGIATGVNVSIMDDNGNLLRSNQVGEVVIQGPSVMSQYENPDAGAGVAAGGWLKTGDQGFSDHDGYLTLTGRLKELINRGGEKISPREIEEVLLAHPSVAEAVAFALPHPTLGEEVAAAVVLREPQNERALVNYCRQRLADFKCPRSIFILDSIPRTASGKVQRHLLATYLAEGKKV